MFKKDLTPGAKTKLKHSAQRAIRAKVCETYPLLASSIDEIIPKKEQLEVVKLPDRTTLYTIAPATPLFYQHMDDPLIPHLSLVHKYPTAWPRIRVDRGAVRFVLSGAALMVPGFVSPGGRLPEPGRAAVTVGPDGEEEEGDARYGNVELEAEQVVVVEAEGKEHACAVGMLKMGTAEMKKARKGVGIEGGHFLGDGLWRLSGLD